MRSNCAISAAQDNAGAGGAEPSPARGKNPADYWQGWGTQNELISVVGMVGEKSMPASAGAS